MKNKKIGHMIMKGGTIADLQREINDFPSQVTTDYFVKLGYKESTAKRYLTCLIKNSNQSMDNQSDVSSKTDVSEEEVQQPMESSIIRSDYADFNNLLVDTCALAFPECIRIIEQATSVTFIYSTLQEMDKKQYEQLLGKKCGKSQSEKIQYLAYNIRAYTGKILENPSKFMLSRFSGYNNVTYVDDILIQYLSILPKQIRPTLLTADKNLAAKAKSFDFAYIVKMPDKTPKPISTNSPSNNDIFKNFNIHVSKDGNNYYIYYNGPYNLEIVRSGCSFQYPKGVTYLVQENDYLQVKANNSEHKVKVSKLL